MFIYLDKDRQRIENCFFINMQWRRRYYDYGEFEVLLDKSQYIPDAAYILKTDTLEVGVISKIELNSNMIGRHITISGYMAESLLSRGISTIPGRVASHNIVENCIDFVQNGVIRDLPMPYLAQGTHKTSTATIDGADENESEVGLINRSMLMSIDYGQKIRYRAADNMFVYEIWQGIDRSVEGANYCIFSDKIGNINEINYSDDDTDIKNDVHIRISRGEVDGVERIIETSYSVQKEGEEKRRMLMQISDTESATDDEAITKAKDQAKLELLNHNRVTNISFTPVLDYTEYMVDYDLGDKIQLNINELKKTFTFRIVGVNEVYKNNIREVELIFGDMKKKNYDKRRL